MLDKAKIVSNTSVRKSAVRLQSGMHYGHPLSLPTEEEEEDEEDEQEEEEQEEKEDEEAPLLSSSNHVNSKRKQARPRKCPYKVHK